MVELPVSKKAASQLRKTRFRESNPSGRQTELLLRKSLSKAKHAIDHGLEGAPMNSNEGNFGLLKQIASSCRTLPIEKCDFP